MEMIVFSHVCVQTDDLSLQPPLSCGMSFFILRVVSSGIAFACIAMLYGGPPLDMMYHYAGADIAASVLSEYQESTQFDRLSSNPYCIIRSSL